MKILATMTLMLNLGVAVVYGQPTPVKMTFSGTGAASSVNLNQPDTNTAEENVAGNGTLGAFTFRDVRASATSPQPSNTCMGIFFPSATGAGVFRFQDGSLLKVNLMPGGGDCIDLVQKVGHCTLILKITGGTGRFENASGMLTYTETALSVLDDNPVFFTEAGEITGMISGVAAQDPQDTQQ